MSGRPFSDHEVQYIRDHYHVDQTAVEIAAALNRQVCSVYRKASKLGLQKPMRVVSDITIHAAINRWHPLGWSDAEISEWLCKEFACGVDRHRVGVIRRTVLKLPNNSLSEHRRQRVAEKTREQIAIAGLNSLADIRLQRWNKWKRELGWPEHLTIRAVQSLEMFYRHGPMTRLQLCAALGINKKKRLKRTEPTSNAKGGTVLAELMRAGLLLRLKKAVRIGRDRRGGNRMVDFYMLNPGVMPNGETRKFTEVSGCRESVGGAGHDSGLADVAAASVLRRDHAR